MDFAILAATMRAMPARQPFPVAERVDPCLVISKSGLGTRFELELSSHRYSEDLGYCETVFKSCPRNQYPKKQRPKWALFAFINEKRSWEKGKASVMLKSMAETRPRTRSANHRDLQQIAELYRHLHPEDPQPDRAALRQALAASKPIREARSS
ncbi:hypothetical protein [Paracoccus cavernae]|uniref:hypothetical protein n=1 Tax=Paracoccus cavernae TaxID=1571207 RepID=UPI00360D0E17